MLPECVSFFYQDKFEQLQIELGNMAPMCVCVMNVKYPLKGVGMGSYFKELPYMTILATCQWIIIFKYTFFFSN